MFKRFFSSISQPKQIGSFLRDKLPYVLIYILFLSFLASLPVIVEKSVQKNFDQSVTKGVENLLYLAETNAYIENYTFTADPMDVVMVEDGFYGVSFFQPAKRFSIVFNFMETHLEFYLGPTLLKAYSYQELEIESLNFNMRTNYDKEKLNQLLSVVYQDIKPLFLTSNIIALLFNDYFTYMILVLISVWSYSYFRPKLKMRYRFILATYGFTIYSISVLLGNLYDFQLLRIIGVFIGFSFTRRAYMQLLQRKDESSV